MPAAAPTELLAEDIRDLRESNRQIALDIKGILPEIAAVKTELRLFRWIGGFFAGILVMLVGAAITVSWHASALTFEVKQLAGKVDQLGGEVKQLGGRMDKVEQQLGQLVQRGDQALPKR
jgi:hypothetical protein